MTLPSPASRELVGSVTIMVPDPFHREPEIVLVATLGRQVENHIGADEWLAATPASGVSVEDPSVLVEDTGARRLLAGELVKCIFIVHLSLPPPPLL